MSTKPLSTEPYKGTRDFFPEEMALQQYIFETWAKTAERFGYERYDASILEPAELYKSKGAENEEMVNEQTYTFLDRGGREVTLRPEMTPTAARMIAGRRHNLSFPVRWYAIPNLFRYERPQRGRLREHWQFNCDFFGDTDASTDVEMIALAYQTLLSFGATPDMFEIRVNDRALMHDWYTSVCGLNSDQILLVTRLVDKKHKISADEFSLELREIVSNPEQIISGLANTNPEALQIGSTLNTILTGLRDLGIENVVFDATIARGFNYYTGTVFEVFDTSPDNNRSMIGGGRYDNLTSLFGGEPISGVGFGMGDVIMTDFLKTHNLIPDRVRSRAPTLMVIPMASTHNMAAQKVAATFRAYNISSAVDSSDRKLGKKIGVASDREAVYVLVVGDNELATNQYALKNLATGEERLGTLEALAALA